MPGEKLLAKLATLQSPDGRLVGRTSVTQSGGVSLAAETTALDVKMEETVLSLGQEVVIIGERPMFNIEETQSTRSISSEDIRAAAATNVQDVLAMQTGRPLANIDDKLAAYTAAQIAGEAQQAFLHFDSLKRMLDRDEPGWRRLAA